MAETQRIPTSGFNPGYGCAIFALMILTFAGIVTWIIHSLLEQNRQIAAITVEHADPLPVLAVTGSGKTALRDRLATFAGAAGREPGARLRLGVADCNVLLALATDAGIGGDKDSTPYPDLLRITRFDAQARVLEADIRLPMNKLPWQEGRRYLAGGATFRPDIDNGSLVLRIVAVSVPGKAVPEGFVRNLKVWDWLDVAKKKDARVAETLKKVTAWRIVETGSGLELECGVRNTPAGER